MVSETPRLERRTRPNRRRQIDPTTCERDYSLEEIEFMSALDQYKRANGRMFPTCCEILEVLRGLGYEKQSASTSQRSVPMDLLSGPSEIRETAQPAVIQAEPPVAVEQPMFCGG